MPATAWPRSVRWRDWSGSGLEHAVLIRGAGTIEAHSVVIGPAESGFAAVYSLKLDAGWQVLEAYVSVLGSAQSVHLRRTPEGAWFDGGGRPLPGLAAACDVDLSITPLTNTLPIRRLGLAIGGSAEIVAAYVAFPALTVSPDRQRYTRLVAARYRYESVDGDFVREIEVDEHGLVIEYPGLFRRVG